MSTALELAGLVLLAVGLWLIYPPAALIVVGAGLLSLGVLVDARRTPTKGQ